MAHKVEVLKQDKEGCYSQHNALIARPLRSTVLWVQEEIHVEEAKENPIVEAVLQQVENGVAVRMAVLFLLAQHKL